MLSVKTRKMLFVAAMVLLTLVLCSCDQLTTAELPLEKTLKEDVTAYLDTLAGNDVLLYKLSIDERAYEQKEGTLTYSCTVHFAWDEFSDDNTKQMIVHYVLTDGSWTLASVETDIDMAGLDERVVMRSLFSDTVDIPVIIKAALAQSDMELSDTLSDFAISLRGQAYRFPCRYTDFTMNGWEIAGQSGFTALRTIAPQSYISVPMVNEGDQVTLYIANQTDKTIYIGQGDCAGLVGGSQSGELVLAAGITGMSSVEDVLIAYGNPDVDETTFDGRKLTYQAEADSRVLFLFQTDETQIDIFTLHARAEQMVSAPLFDTYTFSFSLEGADYTLPARLDSFLNNGWEVVGSAAQTDLIRWYETKTLTLQKGESSVEVVLRNPSMGDLRLFAASVAGITLDRSRAAAVLIHTDEDGTRAELSLDLPITDLLDALGLPSRSETIEGNQIFTYAADDDRFVSIRLLETTAIAQLQAIAVDNDTIGLGEIFLNDTLGMNAFTLPADTGDFKENMWIPKTGWLQPVQAGSFVKMFMENRRAERIIAYFINTEQETATLEKCGLAGLYAGPDEVDMIIGRSLQKGTSAAEAFVIFGLPAYDIRDGDMRYLVYGTSINRFLCVECIQDRVNALWIVSFTYQ